MGNLRVPAYIAGEWIESQTTIPIYDPYSNEHLGDVYAATPAMVDTAIRSAADTCEVMEAMPAHARASMLGRAAGALRTRAETLAAAMARQSGKALKDCRAEVARSVETMELCAEEARRIMGEVIPLDAVSGGVGKLGFTMRFPVGVVAAITPFNAPLNLACHKVGPALAAGNTVVLKPPLEGALASNMLVEALLEGGVPPTAIQLVHGGGETGAALVGHRQVDLVNFTGSGPTAQRILATAGLKRTFFELGGNSSTIVHADANLDRAADGVAKGGFGLTGQSCASVQRVYVHRSVLPDFAQRLLSKTRSLVVGNPLDPRTDIGSLISVDAARRVETWVQEAVAQGAELLCGGTRQGAVLMPTILLNPPPQAKVVCEEVFGPTLTLIAYDKLEDAIRATNNSPWGLQAGIYTASLDVAMLAARKIRVGGLNVNGPSRGRTDVQPYGGVKQSGWGREGPRFAIQEMTEVRMITIAPAN